MNQSQQIDKWISNRHIVQVVGIVKYQKCDESNEGDGLLDGEHNLFADPFINDVVG